MHIHPYLNFNGNCREAFLFYEKVLGGRIDALMTHGDSPIAGEVPREWHDRILHVHMTVGDAVLMGSDRPPGQESASQGTFCSIHVDDLQEAERIFRALEEGGEVAMPLQETFWAPRFGMCVDRFGTPWMVNGGTREVATA